MPTPKIRDNDILSSLHKKQPLIQSDWNHQQHTSQLYSSPAPGSNGHKNKGKSPSVVI